MSWTLAKAKDQLSEVVRRALDNGPQTISVRGKETAVVLSKADFDELRDAEAGATLKDLLGSLDLEGLDFERDRSPAREIDF